jgi:hypothetical protein
MTLQQAADGDMLDLLVERYPRLFKGAHPLAMSHVPPGWFQVLDTLCAAFDARLNDHQAATFQVRQIKEKFGGLRFYFALSPWVEDRVVSPHEQRLRDRLDDLVRTAEELALATCVRCGDPGTLRSAPGQEVLCARHAMGPCP